MSAARNPTHLISLLLASLLGFSPCLLSACSDGPQRRSDNDDDDDDDDSAPSTGTMEFLLVVDNSGSMGEIQAALQTNFSSIADELANSGLDYQLGVTSTDMENSGNGNQGNLRSTDAVGSPGCGSFDLVDPGTADRTGRFAALVDVGTSGSGDEQGLFSAAVALCKSQSESWWDDLAERPDDDPQKQVCSLVPQSERQCNAGFLRENSQVVVTIFSDEGDDTERLEFLPPVADVSSCVEENTDDPFFGECDCRLSWWLEVFAAFDNPVTFVTVGPTYQWGSDVTFLCDGSKTTYAGPCNGFGSSLCSLDFHQDVACLTGGHFFPIMTTESLDAPSTCSLTDFSALATDFLTVVKAL